MKSTPRAALRRPVHLLLALIACASLAYLATPALASAALFVVNDNQDTANLDPAGQTCDTGGSSGEECTLRAAMEAADHHPGPDEIEFANVSGKFNGSPTLSEVAVEGPLPPITETVRIFGHGCPYANGLVKPCAGILVPIHQAGFVVEAPGVAIEDVAIGFGTKGIVAKDEGLRVHGVWFGLSISGGPYASAAGGAGIEILPGAKDTLVSSSAAATKSSPTEPRNVIANTTSGILVQGAGGTTIEGTYIGVGPDGSTVAGVESPVQVMDHESDRAVDTLIGGKLTTKQAETPACDGPCNVIAAEGTIGIDLSGAPASATTAPPTGPTAISGNYIGLAASGTAPVAYPPAHAQPEYQVFAAGLGSNCASPGPGDVTIGGASPTESNFIEGAQIGVYGRGAEGLSVAGNTFGLGADGKESTRQTTAAIESCDQGLAARSEISANHMGLDPNAVGIETRSSHSLVSGNVIEGGESGIEAAGAAPGTGDTIQGNTITDPDRFGLLIQNNSNTAVGNTIAGAGWTGIYVEQAEANRIGGDLPGEANAITGSGLSNPWAAIVIEGFQTSRNEVASSRWSAWGATNSRTASCRRRWAPWRGRAPRGRPNPERRSDSSPRHRPKLGSSGPTSGK